MCLGSLSCWKVNLGRRLRTRFSLRLSQYFGALSFSSTLTSPSVPAAEKQPHSMRLLPAHFTFGMVHCRWWAELVSFKHDVWNWGSSDQRISFLRVWGSFGCFFVFSCVFTEERIEFGHISIKPRLMECCSGVCPSVDFSYLHIWSWSSTRVTIRFLVTTLTKALLHQLLSLARRPAKSPGCSKLLPLRVMETSMQHNFFRNSSPEVWFDAILSLSSTGSLFDLRAWFLLWYAFSAVIHFIKTCVPFQIISIQLNLPQVNFTQSAVTSTSNMNAPELNFNCPR